MWSMRAASGALDELAGAIGLVAVLPSPRPAVEPAAAPGLDPAFADAGEGHDAGGDGAREDAPDGGHAQAQALAFEHALDRRLAHERMLAAQIQDGLHVARLARPAPNAARAGGLRRQAALAARGQRGLPPIHRPAADADLPRGGLFRAAGCAQFVVPADRRQALAGLGRQAGVVDLEIAVRSRPHRFDLHGSGLHSVGFAFTEGYPIRRRRRVFRRRRRLSQSRPGQCQIYLNQHIAFHWRKPGQHAVRVGRLDAIAGGRHAALGLATPSPAAQTLAGRNAAHACASFKPALGGHS